jgi:small subunit ribosomal protein S1
MADNNDAWRDFCRYDGVVTAVMPFGAFVEVIPGVVGLLPDRDSTAHLAVGDQIAVRVLQVDADQRRVSLTAV